MFRKNSETGRYLFVGLGNPGLQYENTRHNAGFAVAQALAKKFGCQLSHRKHEALFGEVQIAGKRVIIALPQTYMNDSGRAVSALAAFYKIPLENIMIAFDDISLDVGRVRIRRKGSAGGHNGIKDIIELMGSEDIKRIKVGVGAKPHPDYDLKDWVLSKIPADQQPDFERAVDRAVLAAEEILSAGIDSAMNKYSE